MLQIMHNEKLQPRFKTSSTLPYWLAALSIPNIGPRRFFHLLSHFESIEKLFTATKEELLNYGLNHIQIKNIQFPPWPLIEADLNWQANDPSLNHIITFENKSYPPHLREISDPPLVLFARGNPASLLDPQIAMVGSRAATLRGATNAEVFAHALAECGLTITSGLALGIDSAAHRGALKARGQTIAVMGTGLNHVYPRTNRKLAAEIIADQGVLLSEFSCAVPPLANNFPRRNRIIAGLSLGVIVIEAALKSGSLITARLAVEYGREVFAIPGSIHQPLSRGCHYLIKMGAKLVEQPIDVLEEFNHCLVSPPNPLAMIKPSEQNIVLTELEQKVLTFIDEDATTVDNITLQIGLTISQVSSILLTLELQGLIQAVPGGYIRIQSKFA